MPKNHLVGHHRVSTKHLPNKDCSVPATPHYEAHKSLEQFWNQYRKGGALYGEMPTNLQYTQALKHSLESAGLSANQVNQAVRSSIQNRLQYGLLGG